MADNYTWSPKKTNGDDIANFESSGTSSATYGYKVKNGESIMKHYDFTKVTNPTGDFFQGTWNFHNDQISQYDPYIGGYAFIYWTRLPLWLNNDNWTNENGSNASNGLDAFKWMSMRNFKSFDGISDVEIGAEAMQAGFTGNELNTVTNITKGNTEFTLKHQELSGGPIRKMYANWVNGLRDMDTGIATYQNSKEYEYSMKNNTGELLYIVTDPSGGTMKNSIEFAAYYTNVFPTKVPYSHLNYNSGDHALAEIDVPFKGVFHQSKHIYSLAEAVLPYIVAYRNANEFIPSISGGEIDDDNNTQTDAVKTQAGIIIQSIQKGAFAATQQ